MLNFGVSMWGFPIPAISGLWVECLGGASGPLRLRGKATRVCCNVKRQWVAVACSYYFCRLSDLRGLARNSWETRLSPGNSSLRDISGHFGRTLSEQEQVN